MVTQRVPPVRVTQTQPRTASQQQAGVGGETALWAGTQVSRLTPKPAGSSKVLTQQLSQAQRELRGMRADADHSTGRINKTPLQAQENQVARLANQVQDAKMYERLRGVGRAVNGLSLMLETHNAISRNASTSRVGSWAGVGAATGTSALLSANPAAGLIDAVSGGAASGSAQLAVNTAEALIRGDSRMKREINDRISRGDYGWLLQHGSNAIGHGILYGYQGVKAAQDWMKRR